MTNQVNALKISPGMASKRKTVVKMDSSVEPTKNFFLNDPWSAMAPKNGEKKATSSAEIVTPRDHNKVPSISLGAMDFVK